MESPHTLRMKNRLRFSLSGTLKRTKPGVWLRFSFAPWLATLWVLGLLVGLIAHRPVSAQSTPPPQRPTIVVSGDQNYPPFEFFDNGRPTGFNIELIRAAAAAMGMDVDVRLMPWTEARQALLDDRVDVLAGMVYSDERARLYDFSVAHSMLHFDAFVPAASSIRALNDARGKRILVQAGGLMEEYARQNNLSDQIIAVPNVPDALQALSQGRGDVALLNKFQALYFIHELKLSDLHALNVDLPSGEYAFAVRKGNTELLAKLNDGLNILRGNGQYKQIFDRWFGVYEPKSFWSNLRPALPALGGLLLLLIGALAIVRTLQSQVLKRTFELRQSEEKYRLLIENANEGIAVLQGDHIAYLNPQAQQTLNATPEMCAQIPFLQIVHPDDRLETQSYYETWMRTGQAEKQFRLRVIPCHTNDIVWLQIRGVRIDWLGKPAALIFFTVVTDMVKAEAALRYSEDKFSKAFRTSPDSININRLHDGLYLEINDGFTALTGYTAEDVLGKSSLEINIWDDPEDRARLVQGLQQHGEIHGLEAHFRMKDGRVRIGSMTARTIDLNGEMCVLSVTRDITDSYAANQRIQRQLKHMDALRTIDLAIRGSASLARTLTILLQQAARELGVDALDVLLLDEPQAVLRHAASHGFHQDFIHNIVLPMGYGYAGRVARDQRPVYIFERGSQTDAFFEITEFAEEGFVAYACMPLVAKGRVLGVMELFNRTPLHPDEEWIQFLEALAGQAAIAIDNVSLFEQLGATNADLMNAYDATIVGWARALELRDGETEGHSQRVTQRVMELARALGVPNDQLIHIRRGALLHDIGKMGIPDHILLKPGDLTAEEWNIMRLHPEYAYDLLASIDFLIPALDIPRYHHEHWDGSGYPDGLKGEDIPLAARIFAVVDVWDALRSNRMYRAAWSQARTVEYLRRQAGVELDPAIVEAFINLLKRNGEIA